MRIILLFVLNAGFNLLLGLAIAAVLGPGEFGRFAIGMTTAVVVATGAFDWLRLSTTRFYGEARRTGEPDLRATLDAAYLAISGVLAVGTIVLLLSGITFGLGGGVLAAAAVCGLSNGLFDFGTALARARFHNRLYAALVVVRNVVALGLACAAAALTRNPGAVLAAVAFGALLAVGLCARSLHDGAAPLRDASITRLRSFAAYGLPVVAANVVFQLIALMNRSSAAGLFGFAEAGQLSLATDLGLRLFLAVGAAVDVLVFQLAVRREAEQGAQAVADQLRLNAKIILAVLLLLAVGYAMAMPALEALVVPLRYRGAFGTISLILLPGLVLFCIGQFAVNPVFQMAGRTAPIVAAALATLGADVLGLTVLPSTAGITGIAVVHSASLGFGAVAIGILARIRAGRLRADGDIAGILLASAATAAALWPLRGLAPAWLSLASMAVAGPATFGLILVCLDVANVRKELARRTSAFTRGTETRFNTSEASTGGGNKP